MTERPKKITTGETAPTKPRRFVRPWSVTERDGAYEVRDAAGLNLATVHFEDQPVRQSQLQRKRAGRPTLTGAYGRFAA